MGMSGEDGVTHCDDILGPTCLHFAIFDFIVSRPTHPVCLPGHSILSTSPNRNQDVRRTDDSVSLGLMGTGGDQ